MSFNLAIMLRESARSFPGKDFPRCVSGGLSYGGADDPSSRVAASPRRRSLPPGAKAAVQPPNVPESALACSGRLKVGLAIVPASPLLKREEIRCHSGDCDDTGSPGATSALAGQEGIESVIVTAAAAGKPPSSGDADQAGPPFTELLSAGVGPGTRALAEADIVGRDLSSLGTGSPGGAAIPVNVLQRSEAKYGTTALEGCRLMEPASAVTVSPGVGDRKFGSAGEPPSGIEPLIVGGDGQALPLAPGQVGETGLRGRNITKGRCKGREGPAGMAHKQTLRDPRPTATMSSSVTNPESHRRTP